MGYLNNIQKINNKYRRTPKVAFANWQNEFLVMQRLGYDVVLQTDGTLERPGIEGETIHELTPVMAVSLTAAIEKIHQLDKANISSHQGNAYQEHLHHLPLHWQARFLQLSQAYQNRELVVSHNDLNFHNVLWDGAKIIPIDFEGCDLNHPYFDYAQFYIAEGINLLTSYDQATWDELLQLSLCYFYLWTFAAPQTPEVLAGRKQYREQLHHIMAF